MIQDVTVYCIKLANTILEILQHFKTYSTGMSYNWSK